MSTAVDQKAYLQKYLGGPSGDKKKKKKKVTKGKGFKIIDDDIDLSKLRPLDGDEVDILGEGEDAPQIAGIIDERPEEVQKLEQFKTSSKWRVINQDDGFNSKLQIEEIKKDIKEVEKENEIIFGKMYSDSEEENNELNQPPPQKQSGNTRTNQQKDKKSRKHKNESDSDVSPPRRRSRTSPLNKKIDKNQDFDISPPRKQDSQKLREKPRKPSRWGDFEPESTSKHRSPDFSPRRSKKRKSQSPHKTKRKSPDSDLSPPRKSQKVNDDSDISPPRKSRKDSPKKRNRSPDSDLSPPRKRRQSMDGCDTSKAKHKADKYSKYQNKHKETLHSHRKSDSSASPIKNSKRQKSQSPQRKSRKHSPVNSRNKRKHDSDSDLSPPRKDRHKNAKEGRNKRSNDTPPPSNKKMARTLEGKMAGLQDATQLRQENEAFRRREEEAFNKMEDEVSGRNAQVVSRRKREDSEERQKQKEKAERQKELDEKYKKWSKGLKQIEDQAAKVQEFMHEAAKPLARHKDDKDLEGRLKGVERAGDPMLEYMRQRKRERGELGPEKPTYRGSFPPNRFNIRPGYRWDGVDRSNGYEKKYFEQQSKKRAQEEEAYKWSTEDL